MTTTREERRDVVDDPTYSLEVVHGKAGDCVCLNDRRICGPKPWGGGRITSTWSVRRSDILAAIPDLEAENDRLRASQAGGVPAGWKLVPVEPTPEMLANADVGGWPGFDALRAFWGAMLPASPPPPATDGDALTTLRAAGWMVAVHNDYRLAGRRMTFWLLTHADGRWIKGEAGTDAEALSICCEAAALASSPPLAATDAVEAERALEPDELLPCPFCGSDAERVDIEGDEDGENFGGSCIQCTRCQASSAVVFGYKETLFSSWNERARGTDEVENG